MAKVTVIFDELIIEIDDVDHLWALRSLLEIPLAHVRGAACVAGLAPVWQRHAPVAAAGGVLRAGRFLEQAGTIFWEVRDPARAVAIELADERCARLVVEVDDPAAVVARINHALRDREGGDG
jgi:hypothetical protein